MAGTRAEQRSAQDEARALGERAVGYAVRDPLGRKIGEVEKLYTNRDGDPEYVMTKTGLLGLKPVLLPVGMVEVDEERRSLLLQ